MSETQSVDAPPSNDCVNASTMRDADADVDGGHGNAAGTNAGGGSGESRDPTEEERDGHGTEARASDLIVGTSEPMQALYETLDAVGPSTASVLVVGESGTGKELVARTLHNLSERRAEPFVALNCAAVPDTLIESELFGHEKGAFTGATDQRPGCFELAHGGTLFLDELSAMPLVSQVKLLRILEEQSFRRLRGTREISVDVRMVAATNEPPERLVEQGKLRSDLLFRLNVFTLRLPPLRDRIEDIPLLAQRFIDELNPTNDKDIQGIRPAALDALNRHPWPGNVRELRNVIERALILEEGRELTLESLPPAVRFARGSAPDVYDGSSEPEPPSRGEEPVAAIGMTVDEVTRRLILGTLEATGYNRTKAAALLGISSKTIYNKLKRWNIDPDSESVEAGESDSPAPSTASS